MTKDNIDLPRVLATSGAAGLVLASAGFGAFYAYTVGIQHGIILAGLSVLMALALEAVKPLAIAAGLESYRKGVGSPALLLALGGISVAYSLTAELSLISMSKGDLVAERQAQAEMASTSLRDRKRIEAELSALGTVRPSKAIEADILPFLADTRLKGCKAPLASWRLADICKERVAPLRSELALAERREALEAKLNDTPTIASPVVADPGSVAMAGYLSALGITTTAETVGMWLLLIPVLALEIGSALAKVLVQAFPSSVREVNTISLPSLAQEVVHPENTGVEPAREKVKTAIVDHLRASGGQLQAGERGLAKLIGSSRGTMKRALQGLVLAGIVSLEATRNGTILQLVR